MVIGAAYAENGVAVLRIVVPTGITEANFTINPQYAPHTTVPGVLTITNSSRDYNKLKCTTVASDGNIWITMTSSLEFNESVTFVYPLRRI